MHKRTDITLSYWNTWCSMQLASTFSITNVVKYFITCITKKLWLNSLKYHFSEQFSNMFLEIFITTALIHFTLSIKKMGITSSFSNNIIQCSLQKKFLETPKLLLSLNTSLHELSNGYNSTDWNKAVLKATFK